MIHQSISVFSGTLSDCPSDFCKYMVLFRRTFTPPKTPGGRHGYPPVYLWFPEEFALSDGHVQMVWDFMAAEANQPVPRLAPLFDLCFLVMFFSLKTF